MKLRYKYIFFFELNRYFLITMKYRIYKILRIYFSDNFAELIDCMYDAK